MRGKRARKGRNPRTGAEILLEARRVVTFRPSQTLKEFLNDADAWPLSPRAGRLPSREARAPDVAKEEKNPMRAAGASRTLVVTAALMLAIGVAACADNDASEPAKLSGVETAARPEGAEETGGAPKEAVEEAPGGEGGPPAESARESPDGSGPPAPEPEEEEAPEADRE